MQSFVTLSVNYTERQLCLMSIMLSVNYAECQLC
jgi:hypothetical protein